VKGALVPISRKSVSLQFLLLPTPTREAKKKRVLIATLTFPRSQKASIFKGKPTPSALVPADDLDTPTGERSRGPRALPSGSHIAPHHALTL
jgi:hypothetical protein